MLTIKQIELIGHRLRSFIESSCTDCFCDRCEPQCFAGACAIATHAMSLVLEDDGYDPVFIVDAMQRDTRYGQHSYLEFEHSDITYIFDATATQFYCGKSFKCPEVLLCPKREALRMPHMKTFTRSKTGMQAVLEVEEWGEQAPREYRSEIDWWVSRAAQGL